MFQFASGLVLYTEFHNCCWASATLRKPLCPEILGSGWGKREGDILGIFVFMVRILPLQRLHTLQNDLGVKVSLVYWLSPLLPSPAPEPPGADASPLRRGSTLRCNYACGHSTATAGHRISLEWIPKVIHSQTGDESCWSQESLEESRAPAEAAHREGGGISSAFHTHLSILLPSSWLQHLQHWVQRRCTEDSVCYLFKPSTMVRLSLWPTSPRSTPQGKLVASNCGAVATGGRALIAYQHIVPWPQWADVSTWVLGLGVGVGWQQLRKPQVAGQCAVSISSPIWQWRCICDLGPTAGNDTLSWLVVTG